MEIPKKEFCNKLGEFLSENTSEYADIERMDYFEDENKNEWLYVTFTSFSQKRININADSNKAIIEDLIKNLHDADWLMPSQMIDFS